MDQHSREVSEMEEILEQQLCEVQEDHRQKVCSHANMCVRGGEGEGEGEWEGGSGEGKGEREGEGEGGGGKGGQGEMVID